MGKACKAQTEEKREAQGEASGWHVLRLASLPLSARRLGATQNLHTSCFSLQKKA